MSQMAMDLKKKEAEAQRLLGSQDKDHDHTTEKASTEALTVSPGGTRAIVINGRSPPKGLPPASMPTFQVKNDFASSKKLNRKTSLKV